MSVPVITFFNNKGGVGNTSLVYHTSWMLSELGLTALAVDLDPQANLTAAFLDEDALAGLWEDPTPPARTILSMCATPAGGWGPWTRAGCSRDGPVGADPR